MTDRVSEPRRLRELSDAPNGVRRALKLSALHAPIAFDATAALERFRAAMGTSASTAGHEAASTAASSGSNGAAHAGGASARSLAAGHPAWWGLAAVGLASVLCAFAFRSGHAREPDVRRERHAESRAQRMHASVPRVVPPALITGLAARPRIDPARRDGAAVVTRASRGAARRLQHRSAHGGANARVRATDELPARLDDARPAPATIEQPFADMLDRERARLEQAYAELSRNPGRTLALAEARPRDFPSSIHVDEWEALAIRALTLLDRRGEARTRARIFVTHLSRGPLVPFVRRLVGVPSP